MYGKRTKQSCVCTTGSDLKKKIGKHEKHKGENIIHD